MLGSKRLDAITTQHVERLKFELRGKAPKTVNNVLTCFSKLLKVAVEWDELERMPCVVRLLKIPTVSPVFWDFDEYARLIEAASYSDTGTSVVVLLGAPARAADRAYGAAFVKRQIRVERSNSGAK